jgi:hypothetical protein
MSVLRTLPLPLLCVLLGSATAQSTVRIDYDDLKIPHIYAPNDAAALYGLGYQQMRDFPVSTLTALWSTSGRMAEVGGIRHLDLDADIHHLDVGPQAASYAADLTSTAAPERQDILTLLQGFVDGVNEDRLWWINAPGAIDALAGTSGGETVMYVEPSTFFLNETSDERPTAPADPNDRDDRWTANAALHRLFAEPVTVDHVLRFGIVFQAGRRPWAQFDGPANILESPCETRETSASPPLGSEGWLATSDEQGTHT